MQDFFSVLVELIIVFAILYLIYRIFIYAAGTILNSSLRKEIVDGAIQESGTKFSLKIKDWFTWNVQTNNEKGTAGGNIKINFPVKSSLAIGTICLLISILCATTGITKWLIPLIMLSFALYHFLKWYRSLQLMKSIENWYQQSELNTLVHKKLVRASSGYYLAGVCAGLDEYSGINVWAVRGVFVATNLFFFSGTIVYVILWIVLPKK